jgi:hypothetical protein
MNKQFIVTKSGNHIKGFRFLLFISLIITHFKCSAKSRTFLYKKTQHRCKTDDKISLKLELIWSCIRLYFNGVIFLINFESL